MAGSARACSRRVRLVCVQVFLYQGCCLYYLQMYKQAAEKVEEFAKREEEQTKARESRQLSQAAVMDRKRDLQRERAKNEQMRGAVSHSVTLLLSYSVTQAGRGRQRQAGRQRISKVTQLLYLCYFSVCMHLLSSHCLLMRFLYSFRRILFLMNE